MPTYQLTVNGRARTVTGEGTTPLLWILRESLKLTGTKYGCGIAACGACTVHLDGVPTRACSVPISLIGRRKITTIEGLGADPVGKAVQNAWIEHDVVQCGYCQSGQIMTAAALLKARPEPTDEDIEAGMGANLCRCGTYVRIREAIKMAARRA
jgi:isoquinoline 1-oxidoreductase alpha subunit